MEGDDDYQAQDAGRKKGYDDDVAGFSFQGTGIVREERGCTDLPCLFVFICFLGSMGYLTFLGFTEGNVTKLIAPLDGESKFCGITPGYEEYPNLYIADFTTTSVNKLFASGVCVKECPKLATDKVDCKPTADNADCEPVEPYPSKKMVNLCIPTEVPESIKEGLKMMK
jgi:hypothetical protein